MGRIFLILFFSCSTLLGLEFGTYAQRKSSEPVKRLHIFSERCSGSFFIENLLKGNLPLLPSGYGHKHFPPWFDLPMEEFKGPEHFYTYAGSDEVLFVVVFRNPYDWLKSMSQTPHHAAKHLVHRPFGEFVREPWVLRDTSPVVIAQREWNPYLDCNPKNKQPFKDVIKLRTAKIRNMLKIKDRVKNIYYANYEKVRDNPEGFIREIADIFGLTPNPTYAPVIFYKGDKKQGVYKQKKFFPIAFDDVIYINNRLSREVEKSIGYSIVYNPWEQFYSGKDVTLEENTY